MGQSAAVAKTLGHSPKITTSADVTPGIRVAGYGATLYVIAFGALASTLQYTLQDSDDNSNWATVTAPVNGVAGQTVVVNGVADSVKLVLVKSGSVRKYTRLLPAEGANDNYGCVVALRIQPDQELAASLAIDFQVGV